MSSEALAKEEAQQGLPRLSVAGPTNRALARPANAAPPLYSFAFRVCAPTRVGA